MAIMLGSIVTRRVDGRLFDWMDLVSQAAGPGPVVTVGNFPAGGSIGAANVTVDVASLLLVTQTTAGQTLTIPNPTDMTTTVARELEVANIGTQSFTLLGETVAPNTTLFLVWNGTQWSPQLGPTGAGSAYVNGGNSFGGTATLGTNDAFELDILAGGNKALALPRVATAVNFVTLTQSATGQPVSLASSGTDATVDFLIVTKAGGSILLQPGADSTGAVRFRNAAGTPYINADSTNQRLGVGSNIAPVATVDATGTVRASVQVRTPQLVTDTTPGSACVLLADGAAQSAALTLQSGAAGSSATAGPLITTNGVNSGVAIQSNGTGTVNLLPGTDSTGAIRFTQAGGTIVARFDTTNQRFGIGAIPSHTLHVAQAVTGAGNFNGLFNNTTSGVTQNNGVRIQAGNNTGVASSLIMEFLRPDATQIGNITQNAATTVAYNTTSDARLKMQIRPTALGLETLRRIRVRDFEWRDAPERTDQGFVAQELIEIYPGAVTRGGEDPKSQPWNVDYGRVTPLLVRAVQELAEEIERLKRAA
jgi:hypothetical protein